MSGDVGAEVAAVLADLRREVGPTGDRDGNWQPMIAASEVWALLDHIEGESVRVEAAKAEALREAADEIERELVCCDVYERRDLTARHHICYWGGAAASLIRDRAAEATP